MNREAWKPGIPDQRQTLQQALAGYTTDGAYTEFAERRKGALKPGMLADLVVLSGNIEKAPADGLKTAHTVCDGRLVFSA